MRWSAFTSCRNLISPPSDPRVRPAKHTSSNRNPICKQVQYSTKKTLANTKSPTIASTAVGYKEELCAGGA